MAFEIKPFSWKQAKLDSLKIMKRRRQVYLKNGNNVKADNIKRKIHQLEEETK